MLATTREVRQRRWKHDRRSALEQRRSYGRDRPRNPHSPHMLKTEATVTRMIVSPQLREQQNGWVLPLTGRCVMRCSIDFAFTLEFWAGDDDFALVRIGSPFDLRQGDQCMRFDPVTPRELGPAVCLFQCEVTSAFASRDGVLEMAFTDGTHLSVQSDAAYEAWEVVLGGVARLVAGPGGAVAVWGASGGGDSLPLH